MDEQQPNSVKPTKKETPVRSDKPGPWSWVVLVATVVSMVIATGQITSVNIYYLIFLEEFQASSSFTAWIPAAQNTALCLAGPLSSALLKKLGPRCTIFLGAILMALCFIMAHFANSIPYLILNFSFLGVSHNLIDSGNLAALSVYFRKRLSFATGVMYAGAGIGFMVIGLEIEWAIETFGWRGAMLIQSGLALQICACAALVFAVPSSSKAAVGPSGAQGSEDEEHAQKGDTTVAISDLPEPVKLSFRVLILDPLFWLAVFELLAIQGNFSTISTMLKGWVISVGDESLFKMVITMIGIGNMLGRTLSGPVSNRISPPIYLVVVATLYSSVNFLYMFVNDFWIITGLSFAFGFFQGQYLVCWVLKIAWAFGRKDFAIIRGYVFFFGILASLSFPPLTGYTVDISGRYDISLIVASASAFCCSFGGILSYVIHRRRHQPTEATNMDQQPAQNGLHVNKPDSDDNKVEIELSATCIPG